MKELKLQDKYRISESFSNRVNSKIEIYNEFGELLFTPLHNKTVLPGSIFTAAKLFNLNPSVLSKTPSYDELLNLEKNNSIEKKFPSVSLRYAGINFNDIRDESKRRILGFCIGLDSSIGEINISEPSINDYITEDNIIPFRLISKDDDIINDIGSIYSGKAILTNERAQNTENDDGEIIDNGYDEEDIDQIYNDDEYIDENNEDAGDGKADLIDEELEDEETPDGREGTDDGTEINTEYEEDSEDEDLSSKIVAYYFKGFDSVEFHQKVIDESTGDYVDLQENDSIENYNDIQTCIELKFTINKDDCREYFNYINEATNNSKGEPRFNQISLVTGWVYETEYRAYATSEVKTIKHFQDVRPFSILNIPSEVCTDGKNINIVYTLYF